MGHTGKSAYSITSSLKIELEKINQFFKKIIFLCLAPKCKHIERIQYLSSINNVYALEERILDTFFTL